MWFVWVFVKGKKSFLFIIYDVILLNDVYICEVFDFNNISWLMEIVFYLVFCLYEYILFVGEMVNGVIFF